jgi:glycine/D-amino acid oxidase-like deaminating enzyme
LTRFPFSLADPVRFTAPLPATADVVIIGGGVIGVTTGLFLARRDVSVVVLEKGRIAAEQSSRNWGWIRTQGRDPDELPIAIEARRLWAELDRDCGEDIGLRETGVSYLARTDAEMQDFADFLTLAGQHGLETRLLDSDGAARLIPTMARRFKGALHTPSDLRAEPWVAVPALARLAVRQGATIIEACAARGLEQSAGRVSAVITEAGRIATSTLLVAAGAWSSLFLRAHGVAIPQLAVRATVAATASLPEVHAGAATDEHIAFRRRLDGGYTLAAGGRHQLMLGPDAIRHAVKYLPALKPNPFGTGLRPAAPRGFPDGWRTPRRWDLDQPTPFEHLRILTPAPAKADLRAIDRGFRALFPALGTVPLQAAWAGMIDVMPDIVPIVDHVPAIPGLILATGMSGHGFGIGPGFGRVIADLIQGSAPGHPMQRFRFDRFSDGSKIKPGPAL